MSILITNGHLIDPASGVSEALDVLIEGKGIVAIGKGLSGEKTIDATGCIVCPGLVDMHVHFREPGFEFKETIATGSRAAAHGGFTSVVTMPNTKPSIDNGEMVEFVNRRTHETACIKVWPSACATKGRAGAEVVDMAELREAGAVAVTDDGDDISSSWVMRRMLEQAESAGLPYLSHAEDASLIEEGAMNEGPNSAKLGFPGMPKAMETIAVDRVIRLAKLAGARVHICHVSTAEGVDIIRRAKAEGVRVTCECAPHYWTLTDDAVAVFGANAKMNPPLREAEDVAGIKAGIQDGAIDCIATDHAPHTIAEKEVAFPAAPFGIIGLETSLALAITELVEPGFISLERAVELMTCAPAQLLGLPAGELKEGGPADICIFDPKAEWSVDPEHFRSLGRNTPFAGRTVRGLVKTTICDGTVVYKSKQ